MIFYAVCHTQALPGAYHPWLLLDGLVGALSDAGSVADAVQAMSGLPAIYSAALLPQARSLKAPAAFQGFVLRSAVWRHPGHSRPPRPLLALHGPATPGTLRTKPCG